MKTNYKKLLTLLPILPLMMANSPAKRYEPTYFDFDMAFVERVNNFDEGTNYFDYTYNINNKGDGYIYEIDFKNPNYPSSTYYDSLYYTGESHKGELFENTIIAPHHAYTMTFTRYYSFLGDGENLEFGAFAYTDFEEDPIIQGDKSITLIYAPTSPYESSYYQYFVDCTVKGLNSNKYYYNIILNLVYDNVDYSVVIYGYYLNDHEGFCFTTKEQLDLTKLSFQETPITVARRIYDGYIEPGFNVTALLITLGIAVVSTGIFLAIYLPMKAKKKNEK